MPPKESKKSFQGFSQETIEAIESVLSKGYCVEIRPVKDGVKLIQVIRKQVNNEPSP